MSATYYHATNSNGVQLTVSNGNSKLVPNENTRFIIWSIPAPADLLETYNQLAKNIVENTEFTFDEQRVYLNELRNEFAWYVRAVTL